MSAREGSETNPQQENQPQTVAPNLEKSISTSSMDEPRAVPVQAALSLDGQQNNSQLSQEQQNSSEGENIVQNSENAANDANHQLAEVAVVEGAGGLPISGSGENAFIKFQLIPISEVAGKSAIGEVVERTLKEKDSIKIGRQVMRDGQPTIKGNKKATEQDVWFTSKVVSRLHAEIWTKDGQLCIKDVGSSSGTFLNQMRLSPSGKESRPYPLKEGDVIQFGVDFKGKTEDVYRAVTMRLGFHDQSWLKAQRKNANPQRFSAALKQLIAATNPYGDNKNEEENDSGDTDCCICIGPIAPFQALFIAPCSHCYHYKCVGYLVSQSPMFQCPLCRQVANLTASVSTDSLNADQKIIIPLPVLESELSPKSEPENPVPSYNISAPLRTQRHSSLTGSIAGAGKKIFESLGLSKSPTTAPITESSQESGPSSTSVASPQPPKKRLSLNFKFRTFTGTKEKREETIPRVQHNSDRVIAPPSSSTSPVVSDEVANALLLTDHHIPPQNDAINSSNIIMEESRDE